MAVWGSLTNSCEKKRSEKQRRKGKRLYMSAFQYEIILVKFLTEGGRSSFLGFTNKVESIDIIVKQSGLNEFPLK